MLDIGSWEFLIVIVIALVVIGPKDLPALVRTVSQWIRRARSLAREFQSGLDDMAREAEVDKIAREFEAEIDPGGFARSVKDDIERSIDPGGDIRGAVDFREDDFRQDPDDASGPAPEAGGDTAAAAPAAADGDAAGPAKPNS